MMLQEQLDTLNASEDRMKLMSHYQSYTQITGNLRTMNVIISKMLMTSATTLTNLIKHNCSKITLITIALNGGLLICKPIC